MAASNRNLPDRINSESIFELIEKKIARRAFLKSSLALSLMGLVPSLSGPRSAQAGESDGLQFERISRSNEDRVIVPPGHRSEVLIRWGDPLLPGAPDFELAKQTAGAQAMQFGYNCDFVHYFPLAIKDFSPRGILAVNHE